MQKRVPKTRMPTNTPRPIYQDKLAKELAWKRTVEREFGFPWSSHYLRDYKTIDSLRINLAKLKVKHPKGVISGTSFDKLHGFPERFTSKLVSSGIIPKRLNLSNNGQVFDYQVLTELLRNPDVKVEILRKCKPDEMSHIAQLLHKL